MAPGAMHMPKAGFWIRFGAYFVDSLLLLVLFVPGYVALETGETEFYRCNINEVESDTGDFICERPTGGTMAIAFSLFGVAFVGSLLYYALMEGKSGQTLGKRLVGIRVVDMHTGAPIGVGRGFGRFFGRIVSGIPCDLGYFWMLWDENKQTWHDKMTSSVVVQS